MKRRLLLGLAITLAPGVASAQESTPQVRSQCEAIAGTAERGGFAAIAPQAAMDLRRCDLSAPPVLVRAWREESLDAAQVRTLATVSVSVRDSRVLNAAISAAEDAGLASERRVLAMQVIAAYAWPGLSLYGEWLRPEHATLGPAVTTDNLITEGAFPVSATDIRQAVARLAVIAADEADPWVRFAAQRLHTYASAHLAQKR